MRTWKGETEADKRFRAGPADGRRRMGGVEKPGGFFNAYGAPYPGCALKNYPGFSTEARWQAPRRVLVRTNQADTHSPVGLSRRITYNQKGL